MLLLLSLSLFTVAAAAANNCTFCALTSTGDAVSFDLTSLPTDTYEGTGAAGDYTMTSPCLQSNSPECGAQADPMTQSCKGLGNLGNISIVLNNETPSSGFVLTLHGGFDVPVMPNGRNAVYHFVCDNTVPASNPPNIGNLTEQPGGFYNVEWRHPAACGVVAGTQCGPSPVPPPPPPPPGPCAPGSDVCVPKWTPQWGMKNSTVLYICNNTGMLNPSVGNLYGVVVLDWSNAKAIWANAHPMNSEELITLQAEELMADDPGVPGSMPRVWAYRNTIKALNWYSKVRVKLDDPRYADWFIKFSGFNDTPYPGGQGLSVNGTFHVPNCDWYNNGTAPRCSGFYHDQEQTPNHPGGGKQYPVDGACLEQCDCGTVNPCGEYIFDHRSTTVVDGQSFRDWFINDYMISNETLYHKNPVTGEPQMISLGWMDDSMTPDGPTEEDPNYIADTGASPADMAAQVAAYRTTITQFNEAVWAQGGFTWMMMSWGGAQLNTGINNTTSPATCKSVLANACVAAPPAWSRFQGYAIPKGGFGMTAQGFTDWTAEFLLTRGPYAILGYTWFGCTSGSEVNPRAAEWDEEFGEPLAPCSETSPGSGVFSRDYPNTTVTWDCNAMHGSITPK